MENIRKSTFQKLEPYLYLFPELILFLMFVFYPFVNTIYISLSNTDPQGKISYFVGLQNYIELFKSSVFQNSLTVTAQFALLEVLPVMAIGFILALMANAKIKGVGIFRTVYALPMAISSAAAAIIWMFILHPSIGIVNFTLKTDIGWLTDPQWALFAIVVVFIWLHIGINYIFLIAGLQGIPHELYECANIDGAKLLQRHWRITIPMLSPIFFFLFIINVINSFEVFGLINIMTRGGPGQSTNVLVYAIYRDAFFNNRFGIACSESIILFLILLAFTIIQFKFGEKKVNY